MGNEASTSGKTKSMFDEHWFKDSSSSLPKQVDLRFDKCFPYPVPRDQGKEGSCVIHAMTTAYTCAQRKKNISVAESSFLVPDEMFDVAREHSNLQKRPISSGVTFSEAMKPLKHTTKWYRIGLSVDNFKKSIHHGFPVVLGFGVTQPMYEWQYDQKQIKKNGYNLPFSSGDESKVNGFHCVLLIGYDDSKGHFIARNSWGKDWGNKGHFYFPYEIAKKKKIVLDAMVVDNV